jgi:anti-sigma B factor antagonist
MLSYEPTPQFRCATTALDGTVTVVPEGELDLATAPALDEALRREAMASKAIVLDLRRLTFIDSTGVSLLLRWTRDSTASGRGFRLIPGSERVQLVFAMTGLLDALGFDRS